MSVVSLGWLVLLDLGAVQMFVISKLIEGMNYRVEDNETLALEVLKLNAKRTRLEAAHEVLLKQSKKEEV